MAKAIPDGYHTATPYLAVDGARKAIEFYKKAFGATEKFSMPHENGKIMHAEIQIGDSRIMLSDEYPDMEFKSPKAYGGSPVNLMLYVEDVDALIKRAVGAGATLVMPVKNQFYGDRSGSVKDPFGFTWHIATHVEDVPMEELKKRAAKQMSGAR